MRAEGEAVSCRQGVVSLGEKALDARGCACESVREPVLSTTLTSTRFSMGFLGGIPFSDCPSARPDHRDRKTCSLVGYKIGSHFDANCLRAHNLSLDA